MTLEVANHTDNKNRHRLPNYPSTVKNVLKSTDLILRLRLFRLEAETTHEERQFQISTTLLEKYFW